MQVMSRLYGYMNVDTNKDEKDQYLYDTNVGTIVFFEPIVLGCCKPSEYSDIGCWKGNSDILPYVERFQLGMDWKSPTHFFELDGISNNAFSYTYDLILQQTYRPKLAILGVETILHCNFVKHPVSIPEAIPLIDTRTIQIGSLTSGRNAKEFLLQLPLPLR